MNILIAGGSGFIGRALITALQNEHQITVVGRDKTRLQSMFGNAIATVSWQELPLQKAADFDAIINLSGHNIAASRWNETTKQNIIESRVQTNQQLIDWVINQQATPHYYCANAIGIYGMQENGDTAAFDDSTVIDYQHPHDYLAEVGIRWEQSLQPAIDAGLPVTITRFGVVLKKNEGMLKKLVPSFYFAAGAIVGDGQQVISWVHIDDVVAAYQFLLQHPQLTGSFNLCAPNPVSQAEFAKTLAATLHRPLFLKMPAFAVKLMFGEMGECLLLKGQRVLPSRLISSGFAFHYPSLDEALARSLYTQVPSNLT